MERPDAVARLVSLVNVSPQLAALVADGLGMALPAALPRALETPNVPEVDVSIALSLTALPGDGGIRTRKVALLAAHGIDGASLLAAQAALHAAGAVTVLVAPRLGVIETADGETVEATASFENSPSVLFDAVLLPDGDAGVKLLLRTAQAVDSVAQQFRHGKTILALGASKALLGRAGVKATLDSGDTDPGVLLAAATEGEAAHAAFITAIGNHRHAARETDPPVV
jgi:catalase